jgi:hypothetical protein
MKRFLMIALAASFPALAEDMRSIKDPVPSPSDLRAASGEDRPQGQAREARTPSPSDLATERPRVDGDRRSSNMQDPRSATAGSGLAQPALAPSELNSGTGSQFR